MTTPSEYIPTDREPATPAASTPGGWFKAGRSQDAWELQIAAPNAFRLAWVIAFRAQWRQGFNRHNLAMGEALLGDFRNYGMSHREYRTAKQQLRKWHFATFKTTNAGTIARLIDSRLFSSFPLEGDNPNDRRPTSDRQATDKRPTTTKNIRPEEHRDQKGGGPPVVQADPEGSRRKPLSSAERISAEKQLEQEQERLHRYRENLPQVATGTICTDEDRRVIREHKQEIKRLEAMLRI